MLEAGPCNTQSPVVQMFIVAVNAIQIIVIGWLAHRRYLADQRESKRNGDISKSH